MDTYYFLEYSFYFQQQLIRLILLFSFSFTIRSVVNLLATCIRSFLRSLSDQRILFNLLKLQSQNNLMEPETDRCSNKSL